MEDLVLSDVHLEKVTSDDTPITLQCSKLGKNEIYRSAFIIECPEELKDDLLKTAGPSFSTPENTEGLPYDEDGDLAVSRKRKVFNGEEIYLEVFHSMASSLTAVGLQVWRGSLFMNDYILNNLKKFKNKRILELGGGVGLTSLVAGAISDNVVLTDVGGSTMEICHKNLDQNSTILSDPSNFRICELDWFKEIESIRKLNLWRPDVILACDVIYDDNITDAFFRTLRTLLTKDVYAGPLDTNAAIRVLISIEKRLNFTLDDLDVTCKEYDYFRKCLHQLVDELPDLLKVEKVDTANMLAFCAYERVPQLEIWKVECKPNPNC